MILYHKIKTGNTPEYLTNYVLNSHPAENSTARYLNSFFPYCFPFWEILDPALKELNSKQFKGKLKHLNQKVGSQLFNFKDKYGYKLLTCLRVDHSDLRAHRFRKKFNCQNPICRCTSEDESTEHYFLRCQNFLQPRQLLLQKIGSISGLDISTMTDPDVLSLLLYGNPKLSKEQNFLIIQASIEFIRKSKRFVKLEAFCNNSSNPN